MHFFASAAGAAVAGFRPCLRCRPESSPGTPAWLGTSATVSRALRLIDSGTFETGGMSELASSLDISTGHLRRLFRKHLGASPSKVAQTRRLHFAKKLIDETSLPMAEIAFTAGFGSIRRFNATFRETYQRSPTELRRTARQKHGSTHPQLFRLELSYRPPFEWQSILEYLSHRAIPEIEYSQTSLYRRTIALNSSVGTISVTPTLGRQCLTLKVDFPDPKALMPTVERVRNIFDLRADPEQISRHLSRDPTLAPLVAFDPGMRVPGAWDGFELAVRAVLGQQVTVRGGATLAGRLVRHYGQSIPAGDPNGLTKVFPTARVLADADLANCGLPATRARTIRGLSCAVRDGRMSFDPTTDRKTFVATLTALPGIGDWTAEYIAMRALGEPNAFPASDLWLLRSIAADSKDATIPKDKVTSKDLRRRAEAWRPWRAYAAMYLWKQQGRKEPTQDAPCKPTCSN